MQFLTLAAVTGLLATSAIAAEVASSVASKPIVPGVSEHASLPAGPRPTGKPEDPEFKAIIGDLLKAFQPIPGQLQADLKNGPGGVKPVGKEHEAGEPKHHGSGSMHHSRCHKTHHISKTHTETETKTETTTHTHTSTSIHFTISTASAKMLTVSTSAPAAKPSA